MEPDTRSNAKPSLFRSRRVIATGIALGLAAFVAVGLIVMVAAVPPQLAPPGAGTPISTAPAEQLSQAFAQVAARVRPAVVGVYSERMVKLQPELPSPFDEEFFRRFFGEGAPQAPGQRPGPHEFQMPQRGLGSGMIIDSAGLILTNYHVIHDMDEIEVRLADKRSFKAEVVGVDPPSDVAVIRMQGEVPGNLPTVQLGDSDTLQVGHLVMAVGAPFGFVQSVTTGVISAKDRSGMGINDYEDFLQTDAAINPGNSGGPLVNMRGEVVGINSAIATQIGQFAGIGFAIPINMVKSILPTLSKGGKVTRGLLGVVIQEVTPELARQFGIKEARGALVAQVNGDSPAAAAGIEPGDVIVRYDGKPVASVTELRNRVAATQPDSKVDVVVLRDGKEKSFAVTVGTLPVEAEVAAGPAGEGDSGDAMGELGLAVQTLTPDVARQLGYQGQKGAIIGGTRPGSPAARAGLRRGDLVVEANRKPVTDVESLRAALTSAGDSILLRIRRGEASLFVVLALK